MRTFSRPLASYSVAVKNDNCRQSKLLLRNHYILEECISGVTGGNGSVVWSTGRLTWRLHGLLCAKNIISLLTVLCIEMKNATITVWLDQETEDKVAVGLTTVA